MVTKNSKLEIEPFLAIRKETSPQGPFFGVSAVKDTIYFSKEASELIRQRGYTHIQWAVDWSVPRALVCFVKPGEPGAMRIGQLRRTSKGPKTFQVGKSTAFFRHYGVKLDQKIQYQVKWDEELQAYEFHMPELEKAKALRLAK